MELKLVSPQIVPEDYEDIFKNSAIYERYFQGSSGLMSGLRRSAERGELYVALTPQGEAVGAMRIAKTGFCGLYPYLNLIGVKANCRGMGVGKFLMDNFERMAKEQGAKRTTLMVSDFNESAQRFYKSRGYWCLGTIPNAAKAGIGEMVMIKDIL